MKGLLIVERFILESIVAGKYTELELQNKTGLSLNFIKNIVTGLKHRKIIEETDGILQINLEKRKEIIQQINSEESIKAEFKELFTSLVNEFYNLEKEQMSLNVKKVNLDSMEEKILNSHLKNLQDFFKSVGAKKERDVSQQRVVVWGDCRYLNLIKSSLVTL